MFLIKLYERGVQVDSFVKDEINFSKDQCRMYVEKRNNRIAAIFNTNNQIVHRFCGTDTGYTYEDCA